MYTVCDSSDVRDFGFQLEGESLEFGEEFQRGVFVDATEHVQVYLVNPSTSVSSPKTRPISLFVPLDSFWNHGWTFTSAAATI